MSIPHSVLCKQNCIAVQVDIGVLCPVVSCDVGTTGATCIVTASTATGATCIVTASTATGATCIVTASTAEMQNASSATRGRNGSTGD